MSQQNGRKPTSQSPDVCAWIDPDDPLLWRHNDRHGVSNHQPHDCLLNHLFRRRSKKTSKFRVTGLCAGNSPVPGEFPAQMASNAENVSIWWCHHVNGNPWGLCYMGIKASHFYQRIIFYWRIHWTLCSGQHQTRYYTSTLLSVCEGNPTLTNECPAKRHNTAGFRCNGVSICEIYTVGCKCSVCKYYV